ncbi:MAG: hypothetical protein M5U28_41855 [Sandaracinaceae bacterium]|nr:hypothetical protein [Sandaracinaceae bacterium]
MGGAGNAPAPSKLAPRSRETVRASLSWATIPTVRHAFVVVFLCFGLAVAASPASAQTDEELAAARASFRRGVQLTERGRWDEAVARFREVMAVRATGAVRYNLALALAHTEGGDLEAAELLDQVLADPELDEATRGQATTLLAEVEPRLGRLTIRVRGAADDATVLLDGAPIAADRLASALRVAPRGYTLVLRRGAEDVVERSVTVEAGGAEEVTLAAPAPVVPEVALEADEPAAAGEDLASQWWLWTIVAGGVVLIGTGVVIGVVVAEDGSVQPVAGNLDPGVLMVQ